MDPVFREIVLDRLRRFDGDCSAHRLVDLAGAHRWDKTVRRLQEQGDPSVSPPRPTAVDKGPDGPEITSDRWTLALKGQDQVQRWLQEGKRRLSSGDDIAAAVAAAVAEWLEPQSSDVADLARRTTGGPEDLPRGLEPDKPYRQRTFPDRHWSAWAMKGAEGSVYFRPLLANACDENFSVRARIYRSLGQVRDPAAVQCLHEGTGDPHAFARAQAVRSLGWLGAADPRLLDALRRVGRDRPIRGPHA